MHYVRNKSSTGDVKVQQLIQDQSGANATLRFRWILFQLWTLLVSEYEEYIDFHVLACHKQSLPYMAVHVHEKKGKRTQTQYPNSVSAYKPL